MMSTALPREWAFIRVRVGIAPVPHVEAYVAATRAITRAGWANMHETILLTRKARVTERNKKKGKFKQLQKQLKENTLRPLVKVLRYPAL